MLDSVIKGCTIVDGTGAAARTGDVGIKDGIIVAVGRVDEGADRVINADGAIVTPGFIDPHTHYDGQAMWDADLVQSAQHGVTTAVLGNCGVGFAPLKPGGQESLVSLMTGVEDIPGTVLYEGLDWKWEGFAEYLDRLDAMPRTIDIAAQVTHDPVRLYVMGDRALRREEATPEDVAAMATLVRDGLEAGAIGFSTGRLDAHRMADGNQTPGSEAGAYEVIELAKTLQGLPHRVIQYVTDFDQEAGPGAFDAEFDLLEKVAHISGRPLSVTLNQRLGADDQWKRVVERTNAANDAGAEIRYQVSPRGIGVIQGLTTTFQPFMAHPSFQAIAHLPLAEQVAAMRDPAFKERLREEKPVAIAGENSYPPMLDDMLAMLPLVAARLFPLREGFDYEPKFEDSLAARAAQQGKTPFDVVYDALLEDEGYALIYLPLYNYASGDLSTVHQMLQLPETLIGLGDAGAHAGTICDAAFATFSLPFWTRTRTRGPKLGLEDLVRRMTGLQAHHFGFNDRGIIAPGMRADLNVIDLDRLRLHQPYTADDLPAGGRRFLQDASGYVATLVAGVPTLLNDKLTGERPGRLVRAA